MSPIVTMALMVVLAAAPAIAQHHPGGQGSATSPAQPYAGMATREIKALSAQELDDLRAGRGMSLALAAELNTYPGPLHALEHGDALALTPAQTASMRELMDAMRAAAIAQAERVIAAERAIEDLFSGRRATRENLAEATASAGLAWAALRTIHLETHIAARALLSEAQLARYDALRGYRRGG